MDLQTFRPDRIKILIFEEFIHNPKQIVKDTLQFLGVSPDGSELIDYKAHHQSSDIRFPRNKFAFRLLQPSQRPSPKTKWLAKSSLVGVLLEKKITKPKLAPNERKLLQDLYRDDVRKLSEILKRPLPWGWAY